MSRDEVADFLGVSLRTVGHWERGRSRVPYAAFKLLRVFGGGDLVDPAWCEWKLVRGRLYTPEGHAIDPHDASWLSLLVRRARMMGVLSRECEQLRASVTRLTEGRGQHEAQAGAQAQRAPAAPVLRSVGEGEGVWSPLLLSRLAASIAGGKLPSSNRGVSRFRKPLFHRHRQSEALA